MIEGIVVIVMIVKMKILTKFAQKQTALMTSVPFDTQILVNLSTDVNLMPRKYVYSPMLLLQVKMTRQL